MVPIFERAVGEERTYWEQPGEAFAFVAAGVAERFAGEGAARFAAAAEAWRQLLDGAIIETDGDATLAGPVCVGGFAFDPGRVSATHWRDFGSGQLTVPQFLFVRDGARSCLTISLVLGPGCDVRSVAGGLADAVDRLLHGCEAGPPNQDGAGLQRPPDRDAGAWQDMVREAIGEIRRGEAEKVVLAREVRVSLPEGFAVATVLRRLRSRYDHCTIFAFSRGERCFAGATPERLIRLDGSTVQATCLAGSTARGMTDAEDLALGRALLSDPKERREHELVVRALRDGLGPVCARLDYPETPEVLRMPNVQHLQTRMAGELRGPGDVLSLVERLHPTPAVGGAPREAALPLVRRHERFDRGWYAGPVGWMDRFGNGEFVVGLRSALIGAQEARLYAGCGILADSDPEREYRESCLKLRPMLWALNCE
jgi:isochorismate synthase